MTHEVSILDDPAISGRYLFPQDRLADDSFMVPVNNVELACYRRIIDPGQLTMVHFHGNGEAVMTRVHHIYRPGKRISMNATGHD